MHQKRKSSAVMLMSAVMCISCSGPTDDQKQPMITAEMATQIAIEKFEDLKWGKLDDYSIKQVPTEDTSCWLIMFTFKDLSKATLGSDFGIAVDKVTRETMVLAD